MGKPVRHIRPYVLAACAFVIVLSLVGVTAKLHLSKQQTPSAGLRPMVTGQSTALTQKSGITPTQPDTTTPAPAPTTAAPKTSPPKAVVTPPPTPIVVTPVIPAAAGCTKATYTAANALKISATATTSTGLKIADDTPKYYQVYGYTANEIQGELNTCRPTNASLDAQHYGWTTWWLNFAFWTASDGAGKCYVSHAAVGLHLSESMPKWVATPAYDAAGLSTKWSAFVANLQTHQDGHKALAKQYATSLYNKLKAYPHTSCTTIVSVINAYGNGQLKALQTASDAYDTQTQHGATQGAIFP